MSALSVIFLTVFIDLIGFGIIIPLSSFLAREYHATAFQIGLLMSIYSLMQFLFSPIWGRLSDKYGRRPIILISLFGGGVSYLIFAFSPSLTLLFLARAMAGVFGGNISAAHAYIADVTTPENRSKGMGMIGAAFGLGFIFGPLIGGLLGALGQTLGSEPPFGMNFASLGAAAICLSNFVFAFFVLKESLSPENRSAAAKSAVGSEGADSAGKVRGTGRMARLFSTLRMPLIGELIWIYFLSGLAMAQMESMLFNFVKDEFGWGMQMASYGFAYVGVLMVFTQGYLVRKILPKFGEPFTLAIGLLAFSLSLAGIAVAGSITVLALAMTVLAFGNGFMRPPNLGMISLLAPSDQQGAVLGVTNSVASLGRILGPVIGGFFYENFQHRAPFWSAAGVASLALALVLIPYARLPRTSAKQI